MSESWPYNLPIFRRSHRAVAPNGTLLAEIENAGEVAMSAPTSGTLSLSSGLELDGCNPSFVWSSDSRYLAVPMFVRRFGLVRRQRIAIIDTTARRVALSPQTAHYFQPESFADGVLIVTREPLHRWNKPMRWRIPRDLADFTNLEVKWVDADHPAVHFRDALDRA